MRSDAKPRTSPGQLFIVATPIGNLADITLRAIDTLKRVDLIAAEDTRTSGKLLRHYQIATPMIALHEHNERSVIERIRAQLLDGKHVALISDAGTPLISDPGYPLVRAVREAGLKVVPIPGPSSLTSALCAAGLPTQPLLFLGFLPRSGKARRACLQRMAASDCTSLIFESPHRLLRTLKELAGLCDGQRLCCVAREITKLHEEFRLAPIDEQIAHFSASPARGECVLLLAPGEPDGHTVSDAQILACAEQAEWATLPPAKKARHIARLLNVPKKRVYALLARQSHEHD
ncbi:MAG: 16S rRNA (cytidine(1402)-2'-O)-methyltransferase [Zetaproteobacteria bacterium]|nr:MAG: 16S rRNA (cytidine(1402)-2'-O)-methyltransferase [Zetaproteobacteria bacterium]